MTEVKKTRSPGRPTKREERLREKRATRTPVTRMKKLDTVKIPGMVQRWVNDADGRVEAFVKAGWEFVSAETHEGEARCLNDDSQDELSKRKCRRNGVKEDGSPLFSYLMAIEEELYAEDRKRSQEKIDETENQIKRTALGAQAGERAGVVREASFKVTHE